MFCFILVDNCSVKSNEIVKLWNAIEIQQNYDLTPKYIPSRVFFDTKRQEKFLALKKAVLLLEQLMLCYNGFHYLTYRIFQLLLGN